MPTGDVNITILDGGASVVVPGQSVQVVIGCSSAGSAASVFATQNPNTLVGNAGYGPGVEYGGLSALAGGTVIFCKAATVTPGAVLKKAVTNIASSTNATPIVVTTSTPHGLASNDIATIASHLVNTNANGTWKVTVLSGTTLSLGGSVDNGVGGATGTVTQDGINQVGSGTAEMTLTGTPNDSYYLKVLVVNGFTVGVTGGTVRVSLDAGRNYGPLLAVGTSATMVIANTGLTINWGTGTYVAGDVMTAGTTEPLTDTAGVVACLDALRASPYGVTGWGSMVVTGWWTGAEAGTLQLTLDTLANPNYIFTRMMLAARDASPPAAYGGTGETDAAWIAALQTSYSACSAKRVAANGGFYNMPSAFPNPVAGAPRYRRPLLFALGAREVTIPPQRHAGRVRDGSLANIIIDPTTDPNDGFIYHDERLNSGLDVARFVSARTRVGLPGYYIVQPNLMRPAGSIFTLLPLGNVMDVACSIVHQVGQQEINSDIRLNPSGTIYENEALSIEKTLYNAIFINMISVNMISAATVTVDRTINVLATSKVKLAVQITSRGYILEEDVEIGFTNPFAAQPGT